jgi:hypothetical protein
MTIEGAEIGNGREAVGKCANEGCGRPAEGLYCDACALEYSLFHREQRRPAARIRATDGEFGVRRETARRE